MFYVCINDFGLEGAGGDLDDLVVGRVEASEGRLREKQGAEGDGGETVLHGSRCEERDGRASKGDEK